MYILFNYTLIFYKSQEEHPYFIYYFCKKQRLTKYISFDIMITRTGKNSFHGNVARNNNKGVLIMNSVNIRLSTIADVRDFVNIVSKSDVDVDLQSGRYVVDGKSIMGIFSLDLLSPITLTAHSDDTEELFAELDRFIIK